MLSWGLGSSRFLDNSNVLDRGGLQSANRSQSRTAHVTNRTQFWGLPRLRCKRSIGRKLEFPVPLVVPVQCLLGRSESIVVCLAVPNRSQFGIAVLTNRTQFWGSTFPRFQPCSLPNEPMGSSYFYQSNPISPRIEEDCRSKQDEAVLRGLQERRSGERHVVRCRRC